MNAHTFNPLSDAKRPDYYDHVREDIMVAVRDNRLTARRVLELGCAAGATGKAIKPMLGADYYAGIERVPEVAERAKGNLDQVIAGDIEKSSPADLGLSESDFDLLLAVDVMQHLNNPWDTLARWVTAVRPGGRVLISVPNIQNIAVVAPLIMGNWDYTSEGLLDASHLRFFTEKSARTLMVGAGLIVEQFHGVPGPALDQSTISNTDNAVTFGGVQIGGLTRQQITLMYIFQFIAIGRRPA